MNINRFLIMYEFENMEKCLDLLNSSVIENFNHIEASYKKFFEELPDNELSNHLDSYEDDFLQAAIHSPKFLFSGFVVGWYSFIEMELFKFCQEQKLRVNISIKNNENFGKGINRAYNFLKLSANYQIDNTHWQELNRISKTRNKIVHENGIIPSSQYELAEFNITERLNENDIIYLNIEKDLYKYLKYHEIIESFVFCYIVPHYDYCKHILNFGKIFFNKLYGDFEKQK